MSRSDKIIKSLIYVLGGLATIGFLVTKNAALLEWVTTRDYGYGDLYRFSKIKRFKPSSPLPAGKFADQDSIDQGKQRPDKGDEILLGDSFSFADYGETPFHMQLQKELQLPIFSVYANQHEAFWHNPYLMFDSRTSQPKFKKLLVYEIVERNIPWHFANPLTTNQFAQEAARASSFRLSPIIKQYLFDNSEARHEALLKHNFITAPAITLFNSAAFELFRQMPAETPLYSVNPPFLFYRQDQECFQAVHDEELVAHLADNIALLDRNLKEYFGYTLVLVPIPDKLTLYSQYALDKRYDNFLPRLCFALKARGVCTVELLPEFRQQTEFLFWPTDNHWNNKAIRIAVEQTLKTLRQANPG